MISEKVKSFLNYETYDDKSSKESSTVKQDNVVKNFDDDIYPTVNAFFDDENGIFNNREKASKIEKQKQKIQEYRALAKNTDVFSAIEEIVNEIIFSVDNTDPLVIDINEENEKIKTAITDKFRKITKLINVKRNLYNIVKNSYIDGQIKLHTAYDKNKTSDGIKSIKMIEPCYFYFESKSKMWKYYNKQNDFSVKSEDSFSPEEIVSADFGLNENGINLGYLEYALKPANMLKTLEDLLVPLRFSRSISRRVFNVDVGELPNKKAEEAMRQIQNKFKYKKFYDVENGTVTNQQHITSMVEDYWFANRSGGKGTQVDTIDETGNLGELDDIIYFNKKLYKSMNVPNSRNSTDPNAETEFDYDSTRVTKEDLKFFMFISRLRLVYVDVFKELLKREVISTGTLKSDEWDDYEDKIQIKFTRENSFIEKMNTDAFINKISILSDVQDYKGTYISINRIFKDIFKWNDEQIQEEMKQITSEEKSDIYSRFYKEEEY